MYFCDMQSKKYRYIIWFIFITIVLTIAAQFYWNYNNYKINKQHVINEIQISLDNSLEEYYANLTKANYPAILDIQNSLQENRKQSFRHMNLDSVFKNSQQGLSNFIKSFPPKTPDSIREGFVIFESDSGMTSNNPSIRFTKRDKISDSLHFFRRISHIYISLMNDSINFNTLDTLLKNQLATKNIKLSYVLKHKKNDSVVQSSDALVYTKNYLHTNSKSTFLKRTEQLQLLYKNPTQETLKRSSAGILLSFLLSLTIISCLFYLLQIIKNQKQLSEIKNDLISNITHEFKTPIATISVVLESLQNFGTLNNPEKTRQYLATSTTQLQKLNTMVEKLLETAALDKSEYQLNKETINIGNLLEKLIHKYRTIAPTKQFEFKTLNENINHSVDAFHFENAINNLLDNAVKYGGNHIMITLSSEADIISIEIADDGDTIGKQHLQKIFDKFYRIPTGNTHAVKGFGIGLYYTKSIIEKHNGTIEINQNTEFFNTVFTIQLKK